MVNTTTPAAAGRLVRISRTAMTALFGLTVLLVAGCASTFETGTQPVRVSQIVKMSQDGSSAKQINEGIDASGTVYRLKASQLAALEKKGVPSAVINHMQQTYIDAVRRDQRAADWNHWVLDHDGYWYGGCPVHWDLGGCG